MIGKIKRNLMGNHPVFIKESSDLICPICERAIPDSQKDAHHLIPKSKGGKATEYLHRICHRQIHALFTETELSTQLNTADRLREHSEMIKFIEWVKTKPIAFYQRTSKSSRIKRN